MKSPSSPHSTLAASLLMWLVAMIWHLWRIATLRPAFDKLSDTQATLTSFSAAYLVAGLLRHTGSYPFLPRDAEIDRLHRLLDINSAGHSHLCNQCGLNYTPQPNSNENCPICGSDGNQPKSINT